jgi:hypothetical protein
MFNTLQNQVAIDIQTVKTSIGQDAKSTKQAHVSSSGGAIQVEGMLLNENG